MAGKGMNSKRKMLCTVLVTVSKNKGKFPQERGPSLWEGNSAREEECILSTAPVVLNTNDAQHILSLPAYIREMKTGPVPLAL